VEMNSISLELHAILVEFLVAYLLNDYDDYLSCYY
jgi:hypothetical protein